MSWRDLLAHPDEVVVYPWTGGREVRAGGRTFKLSGRLPPEHGWHTFLVNGARSVAWKSAAVAPDLASFGKPIKGYLVADLLIADNATGAFDPVRIIEVTEPVYLLALGLERFARIAVVRWEDGRLIYSGQEFPLGPEAEVTAAYQDRLESLDGIPGVTPALDLAFRFETWTRAEAARLRAEAERVAREEAANAEREQRRANLVRQLGDGQGRRQMALVDFGEAARAALRVGGAELLDWRDSAVPGEAVVQFRFRGRRFECVCQKVTLRIVDSGVCLVDHATGRRDDTLLTLESLPGTLGQAIRENKLVVFRHVDGDEHGEVDED